MSTRDYHDSTFCIASKIQTWSTVMMPATHGRLIKLLVVSLYFQVDLLIDGVKRHTKVETTLPSSTEPMISCMTLTTADSVLICHRHVDCLTGNSLFCARSTNQRATTLLKSFEMKLWFNIGQYYYYYYYMNIYNTQINSEPEMRRGSNQMLNK